MWTKTRSAKKRFRHTAILKGFRSGLEEDIYIQLRKARIKHEYEKVKISYIIPSSNHIYTPDFVLENGIIVETKGRWVLEDRKKIALIRRQYPKLDLRMVFNYSKAKIRKGSKTTYASICEKLGIPYADKEIPKEWLTEKPNNKSLKIIEKMRGSNEKKE